MLYEYSGSVHAHSIYSDGSGRIDEIVQAAQEAELDFLILTDHNTLRAKREGHEGLYDNTYLMVGYEINDRENKNHCLVLGTEDTLPTRLSAYEYLKIIKEQKGVTFIAHPNERRSVSKEYPPYPWTAWDTDLFDGIEIWNHMSEWMEQLNEQNRYELFLHPLKSIKAPDPETVQIWDRLNLTRRVPALGGVDAHAHKVNVLGFFEVEVFPYKVLFKSIRTHILLSHSLQNLHKNEGNEGINREIRSALFEGRSFVSNFSIADARGFRFFLQNNKTVWNMGEQVQQCAHAKLHVSVPHEKAKTKLLRNGEVVGEFTGAAIELPVSEPGAYRAEVYIDDRAWIFSNHIRYAI